MAINNNNFGNNLFNMNMNMNMNMNNINMNNMNNMNMNNFNNINNPVMNPLNSNICMNSINPAFSCFPINVMPNMPQNFNNVGGKLNQMNPMNLMNPMLNVNNSNIINNFNNMNLNNDFPMKKMNSAEINSNLSINNNNENADIQINFSFINSQTFPVKGKPNEKLREVIYRFKISECPKELKDSLSVGLFHANKVDQNKTLKELGIQNGEKILFMNNQNQKKEEEFHFTEKEKEQLEKLKAEYREKYINKKENNDNNNQNNAQNEPIPKLSNYIMSIDNSVGIIVNEHKHRLVYCLTNANWRCSNCEIKYKKEFGKYYCSLCDYSMCKNCHYSKKYFMKKTFPQGVKSSNDSVDLLFFDTDLHEHKLAFCRSSRHFIIYNKWICNNCRETYDNDQWSFYCTLCDFDLCCDCCGYH